MSEQKKIKVGDIWQYYETDYYLVLEKKQNLVCLYDMKKDMTHPDYETRYFYQRGVNNQHFWKLISRQKKE